MSGKSREGPTRQLHEPPRWVRRYREWWQDDPSAAPVLASFLTVSIGLLPLVGWLCSRWLDPRWFYAAAAALLGLASAFDAWVGARFRGKLAEAWARAALLLALFGALAWALRACSW